MEKKLRYGLVGAGSNAEKKHLTGYLNLPHVELVAICDVNMASANRLAEKYNIPGVYSDYTEMLQKENLDLISVCTPNFLHADISICALEHGVNVHCEKPLAINGTDARKISEAQIKSGKKLMIGLNNRFTKEALFVKEYIEAGLLGDIYEAKAGWIRRSGIPGRGTWFTNKQLAGGGVMIDLGVHYFDLVLYLMGMPTPSYIAGAAHQTYANSTTRNRNGYVGNRNGIFNVEDSAVGYLKLENGASVSLEFSWASNIEKDKAYYELIGTKGGIKYENGELTIFSEQLGTCIDINPKLGASHKSINEFEHFTHCILTGEEPLAPAEHGCYFMNIIDAYYKSVEQNKPVFFPELVGVR
ncbi:Gfo/Idh/MocA family protein [Paenibacillus agricola]|uniref:Gfo/Idh/MocA family oxidoreductase n=1 Tax=Paenibacillus agricola TaxID=2716264 RepID=A0ABX0JK96_9BACL|nr:Gfo/Idh/MocA family oxidoreductase [Paenibacillus agricola]NHN35293.1 Gfo/Idh/MocA family oxidoreductase [Paenibacillus agricola]